MAFRAHTIDGRALIPDLIWMAQLLDADGRVLRTAATGNDILSSGRRDALQILFGLASFGAYLWIELGTSAAPTVQATMNGTQAPLLLPGTSTPYRAQATPSLSGNDVSLDVAIPGSAITGSVREAALYPARVGSDALDRIVLPSVLVLGSLNTLTINIGVSTA